MSNRSMGELIASQRKEKGLTQRELAEKLNVTDKAVSKWERDLSCPDIASIPTLAEALGLSADELLGAAKSKEQADKRINLFDLVLKGVALAMAVAVIVTSVLKQIDLYSAVSMLGIGLFCLSLRSFKEDGK